jgi:predicted house-cleaning noncanonical NTP pyrophosphatase (MazG superfamily)
MSKIKTNQCEICDPGNAEYCHEEGCCNPEMRGEYKRLTDADLAELADLAEELETIADVSDMENRGPMYAGQHIRSGLVKVSRESAEKLRNGAELIRKLNKEFAELAKAKTDERLAILSTPKIPLVESDDPMDTDVYCPACGESLSGGWPEYHTDQGWAMCQCFYCGQSIDDTKVITRAEAESALKQIGGSQDD